MTAESMDDNRDGEMWDAAAPAAELLETGDVAQAIQLLLQLTEEQPDNPYAFCVLGHSHFEDKAYDLALAAYVRAIELSPRYLGAMVGAGQALRLMADYERAIRMGVEVLKVDAEDSDALYLVANALYQQGEYEHLPEFLRRFLATNPDWELQLEARAMLQAVEPAVLATDSDYDA